MEKQQGVQCSVVFCNASTRRDISETVQDFFAKFTNANIRTIQSHDSEKSIPLINKSGYSILPHTISANDDYDEVHEVAQHCKDNPTILRYLKLQDCIDFIKIVHDQNCMPVSYSIERRFPSIDDITISNIKKYYIDILHRLPNSMWGGVYTTYKMTRKRAIDAKRSVDKPENV